MPEVDPSSLHPHPYSVRLYRQRVPSQRFIEDISEQMVEPLIVNENREIIDGTRRWLATLELEKDSVEVVEKSYSSVEEEEKAILHHNDDRDETFSQKIRVALEYERLVAPLLEKRMKAGKSLEEQEDHPLLKSKEGKTALELAADRVGWGQTKFYEAKTVWEAKESGDNYARTLVTQLDADDTTVHAAYQELKEHEEETSRDEDYIVRGLSDQDVYAEEKIEAYGPIQASFRTEPHRFKNILSKSSPFRSLDGASSAADEDPDVYIEIRESEVRMLTAEQPGMIHSHHFFSEDYFEEIALESDGPVGIAIPIDLAERLLSMLNREVRVELRGSGDSSLAEGFVMTDGSLYTWIAAPDEHEARKARF